MTPFTLSVPLKSTRVLGALLFGTLPISLAFAQGSTQGAATVVTCDECTHVVSVYEGNGGLIANAAANAADGPVTWTATCDNVTRSGELSPNDDGVVAMLFADEGVVCDGEGQFELGPIRDGGWFWVNHAENSALGNLVSKDVLDRAPVAITDPGASVETTEGRGAVFLRHSSTGRIGILPTILPVVEVEPEALRPCGADGSGTEADPYTRVTSECLLGDGGTVLLLTYTDPFNGRRTRIHDGGRVVRPAGDGIVVLAADLWSNGSGAFLSSSDGGPNGIQFIIGNLAASGGATRVGSALAGTVPAARVGAAGPDRTLLVSGTAVGGISLVSGADSNHIVLNIAKDDARCMAPNNQALPIALEFSVPPTWRSQLTPSIAVDGDGVAARLSFSVICQAPPSTR